ncbi:MAG: SRPBCC domain-containing protein [Anaerolineae bacterium]
MSPVGKTKDQGWEIGVRRTFSISPARAWLLLMTQPGLSLWLGQGIEPAFKKGLVYETTDGTTGDVRSYGEGSFIRLRWQPRGWDTASTLQVRVLPAKTGTTISFHQERLQDGDQREAMRQHWSTVLDQVGELFSGG